MDDLEGKLGAKLNGKRRSIDNTPDGEVPKKQYKKTGNQKINKHKETLKV